MCVELWNTGAEYSAVGCPEASHHKPFSVFFEPSCVLFLKQFKSDRPTADVFKNRTCMSLVREQCRRNC